MKGLKSSIKCLLFALTLGVTTLATSGCEFIMDIFSEVMESIEKEHEDVFKLNGPNVLSIPLNGVFEEPGFVATYDGIDISNNVVTTYYLSDKTTVTEQIVTEAEATFYATYALNHLNHNHILERTIKVTDTDSISINFLELGNQFTGDSTFIKAGNTDILIDAGSRQNSASAIASFIDEHCDDGKLEYVIATHAHQDHIAGFVGSKSDKGIFERYEVGTVIDFNLSNTTSSIYTNYCAKRDALVEKGTNHYTALECWNNQNGAKRSYTIANGITMDILYQKYYEEKSSDENNYSVCVLFTQGNSHYLFTGDLEKGGEKSLTESNTLPEVELFKGGHHGSYTANTDVLLNVIKPKVVCICCCCGSTEYTDDINNVFPAQDAITRLGKYTEYIYVTTIVDEDSESGFKSLNGTITFTSEKGQEYEVNCSNNNTLFKDTDWFKAHRVWPSSQS